MPTHTAHKSSMQATPSEAARTLQAALFEVFERYGYGEVRTPTLEYDEVLARAGEAAPAPRIASSTRAASWWPCART